MFSRTQSSSQQECSESRSRIITVGCGDSNYVDNAVHTTKYTPWNFFPLTIRYQFRRVANAWFLLIGVIMAIGYYYPKFYESPVSPWPTLIPLIIVVSLSIFQEGMADVIRFKSDKKLNSTPVSIIQRDNDKEIQEENAKNGSEEKLKDSQVLDRTSSIMTNSFLVNNRSNQRTGPVKLKLGKMPLEGIRVGHLILVRNGEMIPADLVLLATSSAGGGAYVETSSIDGETNLKARSSAKSAVKQTEVHETAKTINFNAEGEEEKSAVNQFDASVTEQVQSSESTGKVVSCSVGSSDARFCSRKKQGGNVETISQAVDRIAGGSILTDPEIDDAPPRHLSQNTFGSARSSRRSLRSSVMDSVWSVLGKHSGIGIEKPVAMISSELPNASVHTYTGTLTVPSEDPFESPEEIALNADNLLLRGAVLRNTDWAIGCAVFTGADTKLVRNSSPTPSKLSQLEKMVNRFMISLIFSVIVIVSLLSASSVDAMDANFDSLWYLGLNRNNEDRWPYLPILESPKWSAKYNSYAAQFLTFLSLLNQFVPLSMYISLEVMTFVFILFINCDVDMYHPETDSTAEARNTNVTDLGHVKYVFSDKTGTLTQNIMKFMRCSVDGVIYGKPITKASPDHQQNQRNGDDVPQTKEGEKNECFLQLEQLGRFSRLKGGECRGHVCKNQTHLTFNAEMFLRVMSLCHTVVVERDNKEEMDRDKDETNTTRSLFRRLKRKKNKSNNGANDEKLSAAAGGSFDDVEQKRSENVGSELVAVDGSPKGHVYQAESPDEGALVTAASLTYGFQFLSRDSTSVRLNCSTPSVFENKSWVNGLKDGSLTVTTLDAITRASTADRGSAAVASPPTREEVWSILAVNKFDSDRKRMSVLLRSPPELGSIPLLLCKGADSSMLDKAVCDDNLGLCVKESDHRFLEQRLLERRSSTRKDKGSRGIQTVEEGLSSFPEENSENGVYLTDNQLGTLLGIENHLGVFASEGLRTLVLGIRILSESECKEWLLKYHEASTSICERSVKIKDVANDIERQLHIVGATAIEDKLQDGVPKTIETLENAGIKLWVLTGDKRETATEIGYATKVLTPHMYVIEVANNTPNAVQRVIALEFLNLVKNGKLSDYQRARLEAHERGIPFTVFIHQFPLFFSNKFASVWDSIKLFILRSLCKEGTSNDDREKEKEQDKQKGISTQAHRKLVREKAEEIVRDCHSRRHISNTIKQEGKRSSMKSSVSSGVSMQSKEENDLDQRIGIEPVSYDTASQSSLSSLPAVFTRAESAYNVVSLYKTYGRLKSVAATSVVSLNTSPNIPSHLADDGDLLSMDSAPREQVGRNGTEPSLLERLFAADPDVRHGRLRKHAEKVSSPPDQLESIVGEDYQDQKTTKHALVIEGAALQHFLGDTVLEEMLFCVASCCESVIACRVSPKQKAQLVQLATNYVHPTPISLAIGDGANDVGMIQQAHIGVGISGLEGQQAVNSSDYAIAQFRFLEDLLIIHGRWNYIRMAKMILLTFYTNIVLCGIIIAYSRECLYGGTTVFSAWYISFVNAVVRVPTIFMGFFDRDIHKRYIHKHPQVYSIGQNNEYLCWRSISRWIFTMIIHICVIYFLSLRTSLHSGATYTSAWKGLMRNENRDYPGSGESGGVRSFGSTMYLVMCITFVYKVAAETRSFIHGEWPPCTFRQSHGVDSWPSRLPWTWIGFIIGSVGLSLAVMYLFEWIGETGGDEFSHLTGVTSATLSRQSRTWILVLLLPTVTLVLDVMMKLFASMYFPAQTQIHMERAHFDLVEEKRSKNSKRKKNEEKDEYGSIANETLASP